MEKKIKIEDIIVIDKISQTSVDGMYARKTYVLNSNYGGCFNAFNGSFGNCQNITINKFCNIIDSIQNYDRLKILLYYIKEQFGGRLIVIADIKLNYYNELLKIINSREISDRIFIMEKEYESTNRNKMVLIMINTNNL